MNRFRRPDTRGAAALEFAIVAPVLALLLAATADIAILLRTRLRLEETANCLANVVTQYQNLYTSDFAQFWTASQMMAGTTPVTGTLGATIISGIYNSGSGASIVWQQRSPGNTTFASQFGVQGRAPTLPGQYTLAANQSLIGVEVFTPATAFVFSAAMMGGPGSGTLNAYTLFQPRSATLSQINAGTRP